MNKAYNKEKVEQDSASPFGLYVLRPIALFITPAVVKLNITANGITLVGFILGLGGLVLLGTGNKDNCLLIGAILLNLNLFFDYVDGLVARATNTVSKLGRWLDGSTGYIIEMAVPIAIGIGLRETSSLFVTMGFASALLRCMTRLLGHYYRQTYGEGLVGNTKMKGNIIYWLCLLTLSIETPILLLFAYTNTMGIFLPIYFIIALGEMGAILCKGIKRQQ